MIADRFSKRNWLSFYSPAKVNLFFRVLKKRQDGFHDIASIFQAIDLFDRIDFRLASYDHFSCNINSLVIDPTNTIKKALAFYRKKTGSTAFFHIHLEKNIPIQGGLGGGSSNAATTLWALCQFNKESISVEELMKWGSEIGSDVPFFFSRGVAYCQGRGEIIKDIILPSPFFGYLAVPSFGMSTPAVYRAFRFLTKHKLSPEKMLSSFIRGQPIYHNDLEKAALFVEPRLQQVKEKLKEYNFDHVMMTGSGSGFVCIGEKNNDIPSDIRFYPIRSSLRKPTSWYSAQKN